MSYAKKAASIFLAATMVITMLPAIGIAPVQAAAKNTITAEAANTGSVTLPAKGKYNLKAKAKTGKLKFKSSNKKVAKVTKKGVIKAGKPGKAVITIKGKNKAVKKIKVKVVKKKKYKKVKAITVTAAKTMTVGSTQKLKVAFKPAKASNVNLTYKSSNTKVAAVDANGTVKAKKTGTAKITVTSCASRKATKTVTIKVKKKTAKKKVYVTVTFQTRGGSKVAVQKVEKGKKAKKPKNPVLKNAQFVGWFKEGENKAFSFATPITKNITLYAEWKYAKADSDKNTIDTGDLARLEDIGAIEVKDQADGSAPSAIIGQFTEEKAKNENNAAKILNSMGDLFGRATDEEGNPVDTDFQASKDEITKNTVSTPADDTGKKAEAETLYRYTPETKTGVPVEGADIVLSADSNGNVTGLHSSYSGDYQTLDFDQNNAFAQEAAERVARAYVENKMEASATGTSLYTDSSLVVYTDTETADAFVKSNSIRTGNDGRPFYAYKCHVTSHIRDEVDADDSDAVSDGDKPEISDTNGSDAYVEPCIDWTVYVDANTGTVRLAVENEDDTDTWYNDTISMKGENGKKVDVDMIHKPYGKNQWLYRFYDAKRNIQTFRIREITGKDANGNYTYSAADFDTRYPITFSDKVNTPSKYFGTAVTLHSNMGKVYDYYKTWMGRRSFDGKGARIDLGYNESASGGANAFWSPSMTMIRFTVADSSHDFTYGLDVAGHEFTHAVISYAVTQGGEACGLTYSGETGALNESYADIIGNIIERKLHDDNWLIAEDCGVNGKSGKNSAIRDMSDPTGHNSKHRSHYSKLYTGSEDNGGVHRNSGIFNLAFYKMAKDKKTEYVSYPRWAQLYYRSLFRLNSSSKFLDARYAILAEAKVMGFTQDQMTAMNDAFDAVGITDPDKIKITLTWGEKPKDLDLHLIGPSADKKAKYFHVFTNNKTYKDPDDKTGKSSIAALEWDDSTSFGPEVITLNKLNYGTYYVIVNLGQGLISKTSKEVTGSGAKVTLSYKGNTTTSYINSTCTGTSWAAAKITIRKMSSGKTVNITAVPAGERYGAGIEFLNNFFSKY